MVTLFTKFYKSSFRYVAYSLIAVLAAVGIGLSTATPSQASLWDLIFQGVRYIQLSSLSDQDEVNLGTQIDRQLKSQGLPIYRGNPAIQAYINEIGQRLAANGERPNIPYTFQVVADNSINAFATTGGYIYANTGLIEAADNEAELAGVLAHEIGHITGRHVVNRMKEAAIASGIAGALEVDQDTLVNIGIQLALQLPNSREAEYDADRRGFHILGHTGYDTSGFVSFFEKLNDMGGTPPEFLSTHPNPGNRVNNLQQMQTETNYPHNGYGTDPAAYRRRISGL
jgi:predicted Zn-dependent protease